MQNTTRRSGPQRLAVLILAISGVVSAQKTITTPKFGEYTVGDDYFLANYTQLLDYWNSVAKQSDRMKLVQIGKTAEDRPIVMAIITSPANFKNLARYKEISQKLARAEGLTDRDARALATEGKAVVWIDGGLHATECVNAQALFTETYEFLTRNDAETLRILNDDILLLVPINPDGMELVSNWYMRESDPKLRNVNSIPRLYQKYVGHDDNRDSYIANQPETEAVNRQMYVEWIPQIMYNQHQTGPAGAVLFFSPFRDPFNYNQDPLVPIGIDLVSAAVHERFLAEGKPGAVMRTNAPYSTWFNGGDRTTTGFHNQIGLLSEIIGNPTPMSIPLISFQVAAGRRPAGAYRPPPGVAPAPNHRLPAHRRPGHPRRREPVPGGVPLPDLSRREEFHRARQPRLLDADAQAHRRHRGPIRQRRARGGPSAAARMRAAAAIPADGRIQPGLAPQVLGPVAHARDARPSRIHHSFRSARLPHRH